MLIEKDKNYVWKMKKQSVSLAKDMRENRFAENLYHISEYNIYMSELEQKVDLGKLITCTKVC